MYVTVSIVNDQHFYDFAKYSLWNKYKLFSLTRIRVDDLESISNTELNLQLRTKETLSQFTVAAQKM